MSLCLRTETTFSESYHLSQLPSLPFLSITTLGSAGRHQGLEASCWDTGQADLEREMLPLRPNLTHERWPQSWTLGGFRNTVKRWEGNEEKLYIFHNFSRFIFHNFSRFRSRASLPASLLPPSVHLSFPAFPLGTQAYVSPNSFL